MQAQTPEVSGEKATTPRYDTIVIRGATGKTVPREIDGGEVVAWSAGHELAALDALQEFVDDLAAGNCDQHSRLTNEAAAALNLMHRRRAIGWAADEPADNPPADWKTAVARAVATARKVFGEDDTGEAMEAIRYMEAVLLTNEPTTQPVAWRWKIANSCWQLEEERPVTDDPTAIIEPLFTSAHGGEA